MFTRATRASGSSSRPWPASSRSPRTARRKRRFRLPDGYEDVLLDPESLSYIVPMARFAVSFASVLPNLDEAFRTGGGVPWTAFGEEGLQAQAAANRPQFANLLGSEWLPALPDVHERLASGPPAAVADVARGAGWASIAIARAYPLVRVDGYDVDEASVRVAAANAAEAGVSDRVSFHVRDAGDPELAGRYDLVTIFEAIHDMSRPVEALRGARSLAGEDGAVLVVDEKVADLFTARRRGRAAYVHLQHPLLPWRPGCQSSRVRKLDGDAGRHDAALRAGGGLRGRRGAPDRARLLPLLPPPDLAGVSLSGRGISRSRRRAPTPARRHSPDERPEAFGWYCRTMPPTAGPTMKPMSHDVVRDGHVATPEPGRGEIRDERALRRALEALAESEDDNRKRERNSGGRRFKPEPAPEDEEPGRCPERGHRGQRRCGAGPPGAGRRSCARTIVTVLTRKMRPIAVSPTPASL